MRDVKLVCGIELRLLCGVKLRREHAMTTPPPCFSTRGASSPSPHAVLANEFALRLGRDAAAFRGGVDRDIHALSLLQAGLRERGDAMDRTIRDLEAERMRLECVVMANLVHHRHLRLGVKFGRGIELRRCAISSREGTEYVESRLERLLVAHS